MSIGTVTGSEQGLYLPSAHHLRCGGSGPRDAGHSTGLTGWERVTGQEKLKGRKSWGDSERRGLGSSLERKE